MNSPLRQTSYGAPSTSKRSSVTWWLLAILAIGQLSRFENVADMKFFLGIDLPWKIWRGAFVFWHGDEAPSSRSLEVKSSCDGLGAIYTAQHPILFKNCVDQNLTVDDFVFFQDQAQNLFPPCEGKLLRHFTFESPGGESKPIIEDVPCSNSTLIDKVSNFNLHELREGESNSFFDVHTYMMSRDERRHLNDALSSRMVRRTDIGIDSKMVNAVMTYFLHAGRTAVYYLHAHMDHFLSFCLSEEKTWMLIDPLHMDSFDSIWSGNAQVMLKENGEVPRIIVKQEKGDILYVPPWWIHETLVRKKKKNIGFNIHFGVRGQILMELLNAAHKLLDDPAFFYNKVKQIEPSEFIATTATKGNNSPKR